MSWLKQKTTWTGIAAIAGGAVLVSQGHMDTGIQSIIGGFCLIFMREAIAKAGK